jgi:AcrR family transcriptional regulator
VISDEQARGTSAEFDGTRIASSRPAPTTARGRNTRAKLLEAARRVFERDGYLDAKITDIAAEAKVATGTIYTYFAGKDEIFAAVLELAREEMLNPDLGQGGPGEDPIERIHDSTKAYLEAYARNADLLRVFEQVSTIDPRFRDMRLERARAFFLRNARGIRRLQEQGVADPELDPMLASLALSSMVSRAAYLVLAMGYPVEDLDRLSDELSRLWANALGVENGRDQWPRDGRLTWPEAPGRDRPAS